MIQHGQVARSCGATPFLSFIGGLAYPLLIDIVTPLLRKWYCPEKPLRLGAPHLVTSRWLQKTELGYFLKTSQRTSGTLDTIQRKVRWLGLQKKKKSFKSLFSYETVRSTVTARVLEASVHKDGKVPQPQLPTLMAEARTWSRKAALESPHDPLSSSVSTMLRERPSEIRASRRYNPHYLFITA